MGILEPGETLRPVFMYTSPAMTLLNAPKSLYNQYPRQFWLMITGVVIATAGGSMIWPFMLIYASGKLDLPLSTVAALISINAGTGLISSLVAGTLADRIGRKVVMNFSLTITGIAYFLMMHAETYPHFVGLMIMIGLSNPMYQVGADAMLADMIPSEKRTDAYAINRIANNAAFALGPAVGGFLAATSYDLAFIGASTGFLTYSLLLFLLAHETLDKSAHETPAIAPDQGGFQRVLKDKPYMTFVATISLGLIAPTMLWILMPVYAKTNFGIPENLYGWIPTTNALMCVFIQYFVTLVTRIGGTEDRQPTLAQHGDVRLRCGIGPHQPIHCGHDDDRHVGCEAQRRQEVVRQAMRDARNEIRSGWRDDDALRPACEFDVPHGRFSGGVPQVRAHGSAR